MYIFLNTVHNCLYLYVLHDDVVLIAIYMLKCYTDVIFIQNVQ